MKFSYNWLQEYFDQPLPSADKLEEVIGLQAFEPEGLEVTDGDTILDFDILPNRAHDCLCHDGLAHEIFTLFEMPLKKQAYPINMQPVEGKKTKLVIDNQAAQKCDRYLARIISNVKVQPSPQWLQDRLQSVGQKSINNVVDATNWVMLAMGQPTHVFDADKINGAITIRQAATDEQITTLTGDQLVLTEDSLVIADKTQPLALAGVKGGKAAEVDSATTSLVLECANFDAVSTRKTARGFNLLTDSAKRFENQISPSLADKAMVALTQLILQVAGADNTKVEEVVGHNTAWQAPAIELKVSLQHINSVLGTSLSVDQVSDILLRLAFDHTVVGEEFLVVPPLVRLDITIAADIVEEIGRVFGYNNIPTPDIDQIKQLGAGANVDPATFLTFAISNALLPLGFSEIQTYTFRATGAVKMTNALASDKAYLRDALAPEAVKALDKNFKNAPVLGLDTVKVFEIGKVFSRDTNGVTAEHLRLFIGAAISGKKKAHERAWAVVHEALQAVEALPGFDISIDESTVLQSTNTASAYANQAYIELDLDKAVINQAAAYPTLDQQQVINKRFVPFSLYPFIVRDVAMWVPKDANIADVASLLQMSAGPLLARAPTLFDSFTKDDQTSLGFRLVFQSSNTTLTDEEVNSYMSTVNQAIAQAGYIIR